MNVHPDSAAKNRLNVHEHLPTNQVKGHDWRGVPQGPEEHLTLRGRFLGEPVREGRSGCRTRSQAAVGGTRQDHRLMLRTESNYHSHRDLGEALLRTIPYFHPRGCQGNEMTVEVSTHRTDWVVTNDPTQASTAATQQACGFRWKSEQLHREGKQVTGLVVCQRYVAEINRSNSTNITVISRVES